MRELAESQKILLKHLNEGGLVAVATHGKNVMTTEILSRPVCMGAGIRSIGLLLADELVRYGDPSPYKSGTVTPIILTDAGKAEVGV